MKTKSVRELHQNDELWQPDPFREPRAWALAWDVTELLKRPEAPALAGFDGRGEGLGVIAHEKILLSVWHGRDYSPRAAAEWGRG